MRLALGIVCLNEAPWLRLHLPIIMRASRIAGIVAIDGGSTDDSVAVLRSYGATVEHRSWTWDFAAQQNAVVKLAERRGYDAYLKYDPDELMWPWHIDQCVELLATGQHKALVVSRYNFEGDRQHYSPYLYPDKQLRFVVLNEGFAWSERLHATTNAYTLWKEPGGTSLGVPRPILWLPHINIYHYEGIKPMPERMLKWLNYDRIKRDLPAWDALPDGYHVPDAIRFAVEFRGAQPLSVEQCGVNAPYEYERPIGLG